MELWWHSKTVPEIDYVTKCIWNITLEITVFLCDLFALFLPNQQPSACGVRSVFLGHWLGLRSTSLLGKSHDSIYNWDLLILSANLYKVTIYMYLLRVFFFCLFVLRAKLLEDSKRSLKWTGIFLIKVREQEVWWSLICRFDSCSITNRLSRHIQATTVEENRGCI